MNRSWLRGRRKILQAEGPESAKAVGGVQQVFGAEERQREMWLLAHPLQGQLRATC